MKINNRYTKYMILPLFVGLIGCSFENEVLVTFDGNKYTVADFREGAKFAPEDDSLRRLQTINEYISQRLGMQEGRERGYDKDPVVTTALETHSKDIINRFYYEANVINKVKVSDSEIRKIYNKLIDQYHLAQIVVAEESLAQYIASELKKGVPFDSFLHLSIDTLTEQGDIGEFSAMSLPPEIMNQIKNKKAGATTNPIQFGEYFYVLKVIDHKIAEKPEFATVKETIRSSLMRDRVNEKGEQFTQKLIDDAKIEYNQAGLDILIKPDSLLTDEDLDTWVIKKYDTSYVYVRTIRDAVMYQYRQSRIEPRRLIDRVLIPDLMYEKALKVHFDKNVKVKRMVRNTLSSLVYQKFYSDEVLDKVVVDSTEVVNYFEEHKNEHPDKKLEDIYSLMEGRVRKQKIDSLRQIVFDDLHEKYKPEINQDVVERLLKEEQ